MKQNLIPQIKVAFLFIFNMTWSFKPFYWVILKKIGETNQDMAFAHGDINGLDFQ
jgi:hypothetical protein